MNRLASSPLRHYYSRKSSVTLSKKDVSCPSFSICLALCQLKSDAPFFVKLPSEDGAIGFYSVWGFVYLCVFLVVPFAYVYILLILCRELCVSFPETVYKPIQVYFPILAQVVSTMEKSSVFVEVWCMIEAVFFILLKLQIKWLQLKDPLEASLSSAPMMESEERRVLWKRMMDAESDDPVSFISGWFFDQTHENISRYDVRDFVAWSMFEGRNQEHLTGEELSQLEDFVEELENRIGIQIFGLSESENGLSDASGKPQARQRECLILVCS